MSVAEPTVGATSVAASAPAVSVVMSCRNEAAFLPDILSDLERQDYEGPLEVLIVDGASSDDSAEIVRRSVASDAWSRGDRRCLRLVLNPARTIPSAMNSGVCAASHDMIVRVDAHARIPRDYVRKLVAVLVAGELDVVGPRKEFVSPRDTLVARAIARAVSSRIGRGKSELPVGTSPVRQVLHAGLSCYFKSTFFRIGGFDQALLTNEDFDFDYRCHSAGYRIGIRTDVVFHSFCRSSLMELARQKFRYGYWRLQSLHRRPGSLQLRQIPPVALVVLVLSWMVELVLSGDVRGLLSLLVGGYAGALLLAGLYLGRRELGAAGPFLVGAALGVVHMSWGTGFLWGASRRLITWVGKVLRRHPAAPREAP